MSGDDLVTGVLVLASIAGPALLVAARRRGPGDDPDLPPPRRALTTFAGRTLTFFGWLLLAIWAWLSSRHWGTM